MKKLNEIFDVAYGSKLDHNKMSPLPRAKGGVNFVGRSSQNHGVVGSVARLPGLDPYPAGLITVALGGSKLLSSFVQEHPFYTAQNVAVLQPKSEMPFRDKLFVCLCIAHNRFRYSAFGREANRTLRDLPIPDRESFPDWLDNENVDAECDISRPIIDTPVSLPDVSRWKAFEYQELFDIERGRGPRKKDLDGSGSTPFITAIDSNNGLTGATLMEPIHQGGTISVNRNGNGVAEAFYQSLPFCSTEDVHIFAPKFPMTLFVGLFMATIIRREKFRFCYGRKWSIERMKKSVIRLPVATDGVPDFDLMERYIKTLPFSSQLAGG
jgi:Type I restriction modification DNA specificity domain